MQKRIFCENSQVRSPFKMSSFCCILFIFIPLPIPMIFASPQPFFFLNIEAPKMSDFACKFSPLGILKNTFLQSLFDSREKRKKEQKITIWKILGICLWKITSYSQKVPPSTHSKTNTCTT